MHILKTIDEIGMWRKSIDSQPCAAIFTMGALHEGHIELINVARKHTRDVTGRDPAVVVSVFVNPTQFSDPGDLESYPRSLETDIAKCRSAGVDAVFAPSVQQMYPEMLQVSIEPGPLGSTLEGRSRAGHFSGVLTVVNKLLNLTQPNHAYFGEKDYQQLTLISVMARELNLPYEIVGVPTVRESDGLAMSSRNNRLSAEGRLVALNIPQALYKIRDEVDSGVALQQALEGARKYLDQQPGVELDYLVSAGTQLQETPSVGAVRILVAATVEGIRLIDNIELEIS